MIGVGELSTLRPQGERTCACGKSVDDCPFWTAVRRLSDSNDAFPSGLDVFRTKLNILLGLNRYQATYDRSTINAAAYREASCRLYDAIAHVSGRSVIVDSSKHPDRLELLLPESRLRFLPVHIVRDGRGVMWSYKRKYGGTIKPILKWLLTNLKIEIAKRRARGHSFLFIRYEDLVHSTSHTLDRILKNVELTFEPEMLATAHAERHEIEGNRIRFNPSETIAEDVSWKDHLTWSDRLAFGLIAGWLNRLYGYGWF